MTEVDIDDAMPIGSEIALGRDDDDDRAQRATDPDELELGPGQLLARIARQDPRLTLDAALRAPRLRLRSRCLLTCSACRGASARTRGAVTAAGFGSLGPRPASSGSIELVAGSDEPAEPNRPRLSVTFEVDEGLTFLSESHLARQGRRDERIGREYLLSEQCVDEGRLPALVLADHDDARSGHRRRWSPCRVAVDLQRRRLARPSGVGCRHPTPAGPRPQR